MAEIVPTTFPKSRIIRTYTKDYADTDTESEGEAQLEVETENEEQHSISTRLEQNQFYMDQQITPSSGENSSWVLEPQSWKTMEGTDGVLIRKPTASNLSHRLLNPYIYRNVQNVGTLNDLATLLYTPNDWETSYNQVVADGYIIMMLNIFSAMPEDSLEADIQFEFCSIVSAIASRLGVVRRSSSETKIIVGGILANYQYDLRSKTDPHFLTLNGMNLIASEVKTHRTFSPGEMWFHGSRGIQVLSALYAYNCPTFLFTQRQWKLFVENRERNAILTFPYDNNDTHTPHVNSSLVWSMGTTFLKAIVICLLSQREESMKAESKDESIKVVSKEELSKVKKTPGKIATKPKFLDSPVEPRRKSARLQKAAKTGSGKKIPSFVSCYVNGQPIYTQIRVVPQDIVAEIEDKIAEQEKKEYQKKEYQKNQASELTLL